jgi:hypothetical protein
MDPQAARVKPRTLLLLACTLLPALSAADKAPRDPNRTAFDASMVDTLPKAVTQTKPTVPPGFKGKGEVTVSYLVRVDGTVSGAYAMKASPEEFAKELGAAAAACVAQWKFKPGRKNGRDVATAMKTVLVIGGP